MEEAREEGEDLGAVNFSRGRGNQSVPLCSVLGLVWCGLVWCGLVWSTHGTSVSEDW